MIGWRFPILDGGNEQGFNNSGIETFNGAEMYDNLAREICQNSLDAKDETAEGPVIVKFTTEDIHISDYPAMSHLMDIIGKCKEYWTERMDEKLKSFFESMDALKGENTISILKIGDYHTCGLEGAKAERNEKSKWRALAHSDGVSEKGDDSGGSYGIGKNAPFVCSQLRTVFYNTYAKDEVKAFQGTTRLMTHLNENDEETVGTGHFLRLDTKGPIFEDDECPMRDLFIRNEYGTDVIIVGFYKTKDWQDAIEKAIVKNFFIAIHEGKLIVHVDNRIINAERLPEIIAKHAVSDDELAEIEQLFEARSLPDSIVQKHTFLEEDDIELYIRLSEDYNRKVAELRNTGMIIRVRGKNVPKAYAAVMVVRGKQLNKVLKSMEPPRHDKWDPDIISEYAERERGRKIRANIIRWVNSSIDEICRSDAAEDIDPDGISQFLPDEFDDGQKKNNKSSIAVESKTEVQKVMIKNIKTAIVHTAGRTVEGTLEGGSVNNMTSGGEGGEKTSGAGLAGGKDKVGTSGNGPKIIDRPALLKQRIYQAASQENKYKAAIMLEDNCTDIYLSVTAIGDDGRTEKLTILEYEMNGEIHSVNSEKIGPLSLKGNTMEHVELTLELKEKMLIKLDVQ